MIPAESEEPRESSEFIEETSTSTPPSGETRYGNVETGEINLDYFLPSQKNTSIKLEEKQEKTRSELATFLIKILAGTIIASFSLIILLVIMSVFIDETKVQLFEKVSSLIKDLITFILTAQTGLIGTALGFYFGSRAGNIE